MRRILLPLLAAVLLLSAVEWEIEQIQIHPDTGSAWPYLALDSGQEPKILYFQADYDGYDYSLSLSSKLDQSWEKNRVATISEFEYYTVFYTLAVDAEDNCYVAYTDYDAVSDQNELYLACDSSGQFLVSQLTEDENYQMEPVVKIGPDGTVHIVYLVFNMGAEKNELHHGWIAGGTFYSELITDELYQGWWLVGIQDFVIDEGGNLHVFYSDDSFYLSYANLPAAYSSDWDIERLTKHNSWWPSAGIDRQGKLHVVYRGGEYGDTIRYLTNLTGTWQDEPVIETEEPEELFEWPSLSLGSQGTPHIVWVEPNQDWYYDVHYAVKTGSGWQGELITDTPEDDEYGGIKHAWRIDSSGYGHLAFAAMGPSEDMPHVYYAKTTEPLTEGIAEETPQTSPLRLEVIGSKVHFSLPKSVTIHLDLYDAAGRRVERLASGTYGAGEHSIPLNTIGLSAGVYFVRGQIGGRTANVKFVLTR